MSESQDKFLRLFGQLPARLTAEQTAWALNCQPHDVPILVAARLLKPLDNPPPNSVRFFAAADILELAKDRAWLARVTDALNQYSQKKNAGSEMRSAECGVLNKHQAVQIRRAQLDTTTAAPRGRNVAQASSPAGSGGVSPHEPANSRRDAAQTRSRDGCATVAVPSCALFRLVRG